MNNDRRALLKGLAASLALSACSRFKSSSARPRRVLILGGTGFVGPAIVTAALARGHVLTLFNRGKTQPGLFPGVETILGDRIVSLDSLRGRKWDAVIDTWGPGPTLVRRAAELLRDQVNQYVFLSTISVYKLGRDSLDESSPVLPLPPGVEVGKPLKIDVSTYGPLKALAEQAAEAAMPGRTTRIRAGLIVGPGDPSDRFLYWPLRLQRGGEVLVPGVASDPMQFIDVRDLAQWIVSTIENQRSGLYNVVGPSEPTIGAVLARMQAGLGSSARLTWVPSAWLAANQAGDWEDFPVAVAADSPTSGFARVSAARALALGLRFRSPGETAKDTLAWWHAQPAERQRQPRPGVGEAREAELLARWHKSQNEAGK
jgi:2'-hydroxyisoflavone reductase